jgi:hypothetical protein
MTVAYYDTQHICWKFHRATSDRYDLRVCVTSRNRVHIYTVLLQIPDKLFSDAYTYITDIEIPQI